LATNLLRQAAAPSHTRKSEREQLDLFQALPGGMAPRDVQDLMA
jgi:plasmid replication initiation protein